MRVKIGCDLVHIGRFKKSASQGGQKFLENIFLPSELAIFSKPETLAGVLAAKEAVIKALEWKAGRWHNIEIAKNKFGRPEIRLLNSRSEIMTCDLSIAHDGDYAFASAVFLLDF